MSNEVQQGVVKKVYDNTKNDRGGCSVYLEGVDGALYLNKPHKADDFQPGDHVRYEVSKKVGKGYAVSRIRVLAGDEIQPSAPVAAPAKEATKPAAQAASAPKNPVRTYDENARQSSIVTQSCQKVALGLLELLIRTEAITLGAAANKKHAVLLAYYNGLVYDLHKQAMEGPKAPTEAPDKAKPAVKGKAKAAPAAEQAEPDGGDADVDPNEDQGGLPDMESEMDELP